ncbi:MAG: pyruvate kinase, partial [Candidatus Odinarchaeota archaeon]
IGPASNNVKTLKKMYQAGMDVCRINFSHGTADFYKDLFEKIRNVSKTDLGILVDLPGPKIRIGEVEGKVILQKDEEFIITTEEDVMGDNHRVSISHKSLHKEIEKGQHCYINDGIVGLKVKKVVGQDIICEVIAEGEISSRKGVNCPDVPLSLYFPTENDLEKLELALELGPDFLALSFIRRPEDIAPIRKSLENRFSNISLISKIEHRDAVKNFDAILETSDGIMVARGDLGIEIPTEQVPAVQKEIIRKCNTVGKPVITATQMLESMTYNARPTRAEASDVANAIIDGTDAVMLSGETAVGNFPVRVIEVMDRIAAYNELLIYDRTIEKYSSAKLSIAEILGQAATIASRKLDIDAIIAITRSGSTPRLISKYRPSKPIIAPTPYETTARQLQLVWGVIPVLTEVTTTTDSIILASVKRSVELGLVKRENSVLIVGGSLLGIPAKTNLMQVLKVDDVLTMENLTHQQGAHFMG